MKALHLKLLRDLWHLRGQVIAVALVAGCGIASYVTMRGAYEALRTEQARYYRDYRFADVFANLKRAPVSLSPQIRAIPGVAAAQTRIVMGVTLDVPGLDEPASGRMVSIPDQRVPMLNDLHLRSGRYVRAGSSDEVLVSEAFASANQLRPGAQISAVMNGHWKRLHIVGVAISPEYINEVGGFGAFPDNRRFGVLWMGHDALASAMDMQGAFNDVSLTLAAGASQGDVIEALDRLLASYGGLGAYGRDEQISHRFISDEIAQDRVSGIIIPAIFLAVAAFLVHGVLSRLVSTQRSQVAVLKAFGYNNRMIGGHFLGFALVAMLLGTLLGIALGGWLGQGLTQMYTRFFHFPGLAFVMRADMLASALLISVSAALLGAWSAVRRAVSLPPGEAMRPEPPASFRPMLVERIGLQKLFSPTARIMLRNIERRPLKAFLSVLGIALAAGILVVGQYSFDALDEIVQVQFRTIQREDVTVGFQTPRSLDVCDDLRQLPGVTAVEPFRMAPVRLRFGHHARRIAILGIYPDQALRRLLDRRMQPVALPPEGLVLSAKLAETLGVQAGDLITVEALEGARPVRQVLVAGLVDELIGVTAYMDLAALNRLMAEGPSVSGAYLAVEPSQRQALYARLKQVPAVNSATMRETMLDSFLKNVAENVRVSNAVLMLFASVIAFGMVYNGARIALSERGNELASLRVLGFTRREVTVMLLGEQVVLTLLALPFGLALGFGVCAFLVKALESELFRMPLVISMQTYAIASCVIAAAVLVSGLLLARRLQRLDLVAVLKTRE